MRTFTCADVNYWKQPIAWWIHLISGEEHIPGFGVLHSHGTQWVTTNSYYDTVLGDMTLEEVQ